MWVVEKMALPLALALLAFIASNAANKVARGQLQLAHIAETNRSSEVDQAREDRKAESHRATQAQYVEIFYGEIASGDIKRQENALTLLKNMDPDLALKMASLVIRNPTVAKQVRAEAAQTSRKIQEAARVIGPLGGYLIGIYYLNTDVSGASTAGTIKSKLRAAGVNVKLYPTPREVFDSLVPPSGLEIRYEAGVEELPAAAVAQILSRDSTAWKVTMNTVGNRTANFVSIFVPERQ